MGQTDKGRIVVSLNASLPYGGSADSNTVRTTHDVISLTLYAFAARLKLRPYSAIQMCLLLLFTGH